MKPKPSGRARRTVETVNGVVEKTTVELFRDEKDPPEYGYLVPTVPLGENPWEMKLPRGIDSPAGPSAAEIAAEMAQLTEILQEKNLAYGDSALDPVRIFSQASPVEGLKIRIDDKLSRMIRGRAAGEDVVLDLIGYLVLLRIAEKRAAGA